MALVNGSVNPLNVLQQRRLQHVPPHFESIDISANSDLALIDAWIYFNLNSRYCIKTKQILDSNRKIVSMHEISVEEPSELAYMALACPHLIINT